MVKEYKHIVSLGYFCPVAQETERLGLRSVSSPFDWCISSMSGIVDAVENHFERFLDYELLEQRKDGRKHYRNKKYAVCFYHDFNQYKPLADQLPAVQEKYDRRIKRFYKDIEEPTLFIRYISDDPEELDFIRKNKDRIASVLKNDIIYLASEDVHCDDIKIYNVKTTYDGYFYHIVPESNKELMEILDGAGIPDREKNIEIYKRKKALKEAKAKSFRTRLSTALNRRLRKVYIHDKEYDTDKWYVRAI